MTAYYYDYRDNDNNNDGTTPPMVSSASAAGEGGGGAAATTNAIIMGAHLASVADAPSCPAGPQPALGVSVGLSIAVIAAALLAFVLIIRRSLRRSNSRERTTDGVEEEEWGVEGGEGYHHGVRLEDGENRGDESAIIPSRRGREGGRYGSSTNIVSTADDDGDDNGIGCISLDLAMSGYHQRLQRQPRRQWLSWSGPRPPGRKSLVAIRRRRRGYPIIPPLANTDLQCERRDNDNALTAGNMARGTIQECKNDDVAMYD
jgi:hypothetical protein